MTIASRKPHGSSNWGMGLMGPSYFGGRFATDLIKTGITYSGFIETDLAGGDVTIPATDAAGWPLAVAAGRRVYCAIGTQSSSFLEAGTYQADFTGSLAGGGTLHLMVNDSLSGGGSRNIFITASGQQFEIGTPGDDNWQAIWTGPITAFPTLAKIWRVADGNPATVAARSIHTDFYKLHGHLRPMDALGAAPFGVNAAGTYGGGVLEFVIRVKKTGGAATSPYYLVTPGDRDGSELASMPVPGETITGVDSEAEGILLSFENPSNAAVGVNEPETEDHRHYMMVQPVTGTFEAGEVLEFGTSLLRAVVDDDDQIGTANRAVRLLDHEAATAPAVFQERAGGLYEYIDLCNQSQTGLYLNLPITCTEDYATFAATLVRDTLLPWLPVKTAVANEAFNAGFRRTQRHYAGECVRNGFVDGVPPGDSLLAATMAGYGHHSSLIMDAVAAVFTGDTHAPRITLALEGWFGAPTYNTLLMDFDLGTGDLVHEHHTALSLAPYVNNEGGGGETTVQQLYDNAIAYLNGDMSTFGALNKAACDTRSLRMIGYEGGQTFFFNTDYALKLAIQTSPLMADLYEAYFLKVKAWGFEEFTYYVEPHTWGPPENPYGAWGISESLFDLTGPKAATWVAELASHIPAKPVGQTIEALTSTSFDLRVPLTTLVRHVYRQVSSAADSTVVKVGVIPIGEETIANTSLAEAVNYTLTVIAEDDHGLSEPLEFTQATTGGSVAPTPPIISAVALDAVAGTTPVLVTKTHGTGDGTITTNVEVSTDGLTSWTEIQATNASGTYTYTAAPSGVERHYRGKSTSEHGTSAYSNVYGPVLAMPAKLGAPTLFQVSPTTNRGELAPPVPAGSSYKVYRRLEGVNPFVDRGLTVTLEGGVLKWSDIGAVLGTAYDYAMTTVDENGDEGEMGTLATITTMSGGSGGGGGTLGSAVIFSVRGAGQLLRGLSPRGRR